MAKPENLGLGEYSKGVINSFSHDLIWAALAVDRAQPALKIPITVQDNPKKVLDEGCVIIRTLMPSAGDLPQYIVIRILRPHNLLLDTDILADDESTLVQEQRSEQPAHTSIAVIEWMQRKSHMNIGISMNESTTWLPSACR